MYRFSGKSKDEHTKSELHSSGLLCSESWKFLTDFSGRSIDLGSYFLLPCLARAVYHRFLHNNLPELSHDLQTRIFSGICMLVLCPIFFLQLVVLEHISGTTAWSACYPDFNSFNAFILT